jgi:dihydroflavonol-4-reductase
MSGESCVVFLTGATGFVGRALAPLLVAQGFEVHALARGTSDRGVHGALPIRWAQGDLTRPESLGPAVAAAAAAGRPALCIHAAATISYDRRDRRLQDSVNVSATQVVLEAAKAAGFERTVHVGSVVAVGAAPDAEALLDEDAPWDPRLEFVDYVRTKRRADELALALGAIVVDPGAIFGPGAEHSNTTRFVDRVRRRGAPMLVPPGGLAVVDVDDVAAGIVAAGERGRPGRRYLLVESNRSLLELFSLAADLCGAARPRGVLGPRPWRALVAGSRLVERLARLGPLAPDGLALLGEHFRFHALRAREELGWRPRPFEATLARTLAWLGGRATAR